MSTINIFCFLILHVGILYGQDVRTEVLVWKAYKTKNLKNNEVFEYSCSFVSSPQEIQWHQKNGTHITRFAVVSVEGTWGEISQDGKIAYQVNENGIAGKVLIERTADEVLITLDFSKANPNAIHQLFYISTVDRQN